MENQEQPNLLESLVSIIIGIWQTGMGFIQTFFGFAVVRFYYAIPIWIVWSFIVAPQFALPQLNFLEIWGILIAFDCFRFDITKFAPVAEQ